MEISMGFICAVIDHVVHFQILLLSVQNEACGMLVYQRVALLVHT
jgi:hypothetical protein